MKQKQEQLSGIQIRSKKGGRGQEVVPPTGNRLNAIENSLLKIMKYGSEKPSEVGMTRKSALLEKQPQQQQQQPLAMQTTTIHRTFAHRIMLLY